MPMRSTILIALLTVAAPVAPAKDDKFRMWDSLLGRYAESEDGITWTWPAGQESVVNKGNTGDWPTGNQCGDPDVLKFGGQYWITFWSTGHRRNEAFDGMGIKRSRDGILWTPEPANPVFYMGPNGDRDEMVVGDHAMIRDGDRFKLWHVGITRGQRGYRNEFGYAESPDGLRWRKCRLKPLLTQAQRAPGTGAKFKRTFLGSLWISGSMVATALSMAIIFGGIFGQSLKEAFPFILAGLICFGLAAFPISEGQEAFMANAGIIRNHAYPFMYYVFEVVCKNFFLTLHHIIVFAIAMLLVGAIKIPHWSILLALPLLLFNMVVWTTITSMIASRFRDLRFLLPYIAQLMAVITPIFWRADQL